MNILEIVDRKTLVVIIVGIGIVAYFFWPTILAWLNKKAKSITPTQPGQTNVVPSVPSKELPYTYLNVPSNLDTTCTATDLGNLTAIEIELGIVTECQPDYGLYEFRASRINKVAKELKANESVPAAKKR